MAAACWSVTRPSDAGVTSLVNSMPTVLGEDVPERAISGISMKSSSRSTASLTTSGEPSIRTASPSISLCNPNGTDSRRCISFADCCEPPRVIITDKLRSYGAAKRVVMPRVVHRQHRYLNNRAENSHEPTRERERRMRRFKSARHAQWFVEVHGIVASHFRPRRHLLSATDYRHLRRKRFRVWNEVTEASALA
jgi:hypothetical protein